MGGFASEVFESGEVVIVGGLFVSKVIYQLILLRLLFAYAEIFRNYRSCLETHQDEKV